MIELYAAPTPNVQKVSILLEELAMPYTVKRVQVGKGEQFRSEFLAISPNNKVPVIVDPEGPEGEPYALFESAAILLYLADKSDGRFMPKGRRGRYDLLQWLFFQMASIGPMLGQAHHFRLYAPEKIPYAVERYTNEARRLYGVLERRLEDRPFLVDAYSIADMAVFPWIRWHESQGVYLDTFPRLKGWFVGIAERPAARRGVMILADTLPHGRTDAPVPLLSDESRENLFGRTQYLRRT